MGISEFGGQVVRWAVLGSMLAAAACGGGRETVEPAAPAQEATQADDGQAVLEAHRAMIRAYEAGDVEGFVSALDPSPELLIFHPLVDNRFQGIDEIRAGLGRMFERLGSSTWTEVHSALTVEGDVAWITSHVLVQSPRLEPSFVGRGTEIWVRRPGGWRLVHGHWSENPVIHAP